MNWRNWLRNMCPSDWTDNDALKFINFECTEVTLDMLQSERYALSA